MATPRTVVSTFTALAHPSTETEIVSILVNLLNLPLGMVWLYLAYYRDRTTKIHNYNKSRNAKKKKKKRVTVFWA